jgi:methylated-DNA-[protein]-cysteine S-methyltransferase
MTTYAHLFPMPVGDLFTAVDESGALLRLQFAAYRDCGDLTAGLGRPIEWNAERCAHVERQLAEYFPICIVVPCHRVIGANGALTGFESGVDIKRFLLQHERK